MVSRSQGRSQKSLEHRDHRFHLPALTIALFVSLPSGLHPTTMFCRGQLIRPTPAGRGHDRDRAVLLARVQMVRLRIITRIAQQALDAGQFRGVIQQRFEILVIRPRAAIGMKAQRDVAQAIAKNRELGEGGLLVVLRTRVAFHLFFQLPFLLCRLLLTFAKVMRRLTILQAGGIERRVLDSLFQQLFFCANFTVDSSNDFADQSLSRRLDAFWIVV